MIQDSEIFPEAVCRIIEKIADTDVTVLIHGESGTGKELVARRLHALSRRAGGPFIAVNSAALADSMIESELFGHLRGAFTGAVADKPGRLALAAGGTLFLDEIGDLSAKGQADLLRVIEDHMFRPLGSRTMVRADARFITATHRDLDRACKEGNFREDLLYRLNVISISLPPLRERSADIGPLCDYFLKQFCTRHGRPRKTITRAAIGVLKRFSWPGNIRQLRNFVEQSVLLCDKSRIDISDLPDWVCGQPPACPAAANAPETPATLADVEQNHIRRVIDHCNGNRTRAAEVLGISRRALHYKLYTM